MSEGVTPFIYIGAVTVSAVLLIIACTMARRKPGPWSVKLAKVLGVVLLLKGGLWIYTTLAQGPWSIQTGLPLYLCDISVFIAAAACWWRIPWLVEITYFWGLAGVLQGTVTPELPDRFPHLLFIQYTVGHICVVAAAVYLTAGLRIIPRKGAMLRVFEWTLGYTALVGILDWTSGANYMLLRAKPPTWSLLSIMSPWPWYILEAAGLGLIFFLILDAFFWHQRRSEHSRASL